MGKTRLVAFVSLLLLGCGGASGNLAEVRQRLLKDLPLGSVPEKVLTYLDQHSIQHGRYQTDSVEGNVIKAVLHERDRWWSLVKKSFTVTFRFDAQGRLVDCVVQVAYTGP